MRFVVCGDPDGDEAVGGAMACGLAGELARHGHDVELAAGPARLPMMGEDDWLHVVGDLALHDAGAAWVLQAVGSCPGAVSVDLFLPEGHDDALSHWEVLDPLLQLVGLAGGVLFARASDIAALCDDPGQDPVAVTQTWAEAYGLALCVVVDDVLVTAVKADGRATEVAHGGDLGPRDRGRLVGGFLAGYVVNPMELESALANP